MAGRAEEHLVAEEQSDTHRAVGHDQRSLSVETRDGWHCEQRSQHHGDLHESFDKPEGPQRSLRPDEIVHQQGVRPSVAIREQARRADQHRRWNCHTGRAAQNRARVQLEAGEVVTGDRNQDVRATGNRPHPRVATNDHHDCHRAHHEGGVNARKEASSFDGTRDKLGERHEVPVLRQGAKVILECDRHFDVGERVAAKGHERVRGRRVDAEDEAERLAQGRRGVGDWCCARDRLVVRLAIREPRELRPARHPETRRR